MVAEMEEVFSFFDTDHDGRLAVGDFASAVRSLGFSPSEAELATMEHMIARVHGGFLGWREFVAFLSTHVAPREEKHAEDPERIQEAFELFGDLYRGGDDGTIAAKDLERLVTRSGEPLDERSFTFLLRVAPPDEEGNVKYDALVDAVAKQATRAAQAAGAAPSE